ncbi:hypothetical protein [Dactylosporangium sp. CS-033363]|uniref:hypothetical protein n=1 Tax=Dactylosporangium sp. CS-033363 TaxID=3239935 RepID=UPI003D8B6998
MSKLETLGVLAHRGGLIAEHPQLTVGVVHAVSRPTGLELELLARRPLDRRTAAERQADIRAGRTGPPPAPRRLLPAFDEGMELRVGWLDEDGRAHWEFGSWEGSSGDFFGGSEGPSLRTRLHFPPRYSHVPVVLAWPEIGFPETVVDLPLPDRATVERGTVSIWDAPLDGREPPDGLTYRAEDAPLDEPHVEAGRVAAAPRVLNREEDAAVVLTRLTAIGDLLALEVSSVARGERARAASATAFPPRDPTRAPGAALAAVHSRSATWARSHTGSAAGGYETFEASTGYTVRRPAGNTLTLLSTWPAAGLAARCTTVELDG